MDMVCIIGVINEIIIGITNETIVTKIIKEVFIQFINSKPVGVSGVSEGLNSYKIVFLCGLSL